MSVYFINYYLYRSNPIIFRNIKIPAESTVDDLLSVFCLAMGLSVTHGAIWNNEQLLDENERLCDVFGTGSEFVNSEGKAVVYPEKAGAEPISLTFFYEITKESNEVVSIPAVEDGSSFNLPLNIYRIGLINDILQSLKSYSSYNVAGYGTFFDSQQLFAPKKINKQIQAWFKPDSINSLKMEYGFPLISVLESKSVAELRWLESHLIRYSYSTRKAEYVSNLNRAILDKTPDIIFDEMSLSEYNLFKALVTEGIQPPNISSMIDEYFPVLYHYGMIGYTKKNGLMLWSDLLDNYEEWFDSDQEALFRMGKRIHTVISWCCFHYGIVSKKNCKAVLDKLYPGEVSDEALTQYWKYAKNDRAAGICYIISPFSTDNIAFDSDLLKEKELSIYLNILLLDSTPRYIPDNKKEVELFESPVDISKYAPSYSKFSSFLSYNFYYYSELDSILKSITNILRSGRSAEYACCEAEKMLRGTWRYNTERAKGIADTIKDLQKEIPDILYYGYTHAAAIKKKIPMKAKQEASTYLKGIFDDGKNTAASARIAGKRGRR